MAGYNPQHGPDKGPLPPAFNAAPPIPKPTRSSFPVVRGAPNNMVSAMQTGYTYLFPPKHCKIHIFTTPVPPWEQPLLALSGQNYIMLLVPCNMTIRTLMKSLGCETPKTSKLYEVQEHGNGRWLRGLSIGGEDSRVGKTLQEVGWDETRTGAPGERPIVWLWGRKE